MKIYLSKRQVDLLLILEQNTNWATSEDVGLLLNASNKTIQKEIHTLNYLMPDNWSIQITNGLGYLLEYPYSETVNSRFGIEKNRLVYEILNLIINKKATNLTGIANELFTSVSTTHQLIQDMNKSLKKLYNIEIVDRPLRIVGDENPIRRLIFDMGFFITKEFNYHELVNFHKKELDIFIIENIQVTIFLNNKITFYIFLDTTIKRIREGYKAEGLPEDLIEYAMSTKLYKRIEPLFPYLEKLYSVKLSTNEKSILYYAFIRTEFHLVESYAPEFFTQERIIDSTFLSFIDYLTKIFDLDLKQSVPFLINVFNIYYLNHYIISLSNNETLKEPGFFDNVIENHNLPLKKFEILYEEWEEPEKIKLSKQTMTSILILVQEFNLTQAKVNVLVIKSHAFVLNNLLLTELKYKLGTNVNFLAYEPSKNRNFEAFQKDIDFVLTDIVLPKDILSLPHVYLNENITDKKLQMIQKIVDDILDERKKLTIKTPETSQKK